MRFDSYDNVYLIGIGGIGMSALAYHFKKAGKSVSGYDKTPSDMTRAMEKAGIRVFFDNDERPINEFSRENTLVIYTPAVPENQSDRVFFKANDFPVYKRSQILGAITEHSFCFAIGGTHGKTTTSAILAHLLKTAKLPVTAFLGGISENYGSNYISDGTDISVVEADEFDRSFLRLHPRVISVSSMDADHLDIYGNSSSIQEAFKEFSDKVADKSRVFVRFGLPVKGVTFGLEPAADYTAENIKILPGEGFQFDLKMPDTTWKDVKFSYYGGHNLINALSAVAMARCVNVSEALLRQGLSTFRGVKRRFSYRINTPDLVYIDDYAHHPSEINALGDTVSAMYPNKPVTAVFQPHLYSRTNDFMDDFARSLSRFRHVILLEIYPARELPIEGVTSQKLLDKITAPRKEICSKEMLPALLKRLNPEILLTIGAGDIGEEVETITKTLMPTSV